MHTSPRWLAPIVAAACIVAATDARAQVSPTGSIAPTTVKLPDGPGSVSGLAKPAELDLFSAQVEYSVPVRVPTAGGLSPSVALSYSGALGSGPLGIGWTLGAPAIRRSLREGVPRYDDSDELTIEGVGGGRLVRIRDGQYVAEGSGCTLRVRRFDGYFEVTDGDGTRYYFGHTAPARLAQGTRVAAWFLEEVVNLAGESMRFEYLTDRGQVYLRRILWGPDERYQLEVVLASRPDVIPSFATGFEVTTARRVAEIRTRVDLPDGAPEELARYALAYDDDGDLPVSRLTGVTMTGHRDRDGNLLPGGTLPPVTFTYTVPDAPRSWTLESGGWVLEQRGVALVDVDGDGADDLLRLEPGYVAWRRNLGGRFGTALPFDNANLELSRVRFLDVDGDARPEVVRLVDDTWRAYTIEGSANPRLSDGRVLEGSRNVGLGGGSTILADINGDGRTDVIEAVTGGLRMRRGVPVGLGPAAYLPPISTADRYVEPGVSGVRFVDANGDGLADVVWMTDAWMKVFLGKGDGTFVPYAKVIYPWGTGSIPLDHLHLVDLDRDGLLDLLRVDAGKVRWFGGLAGFRFERFPRQLDRPPGADADVRVTFADVDGNGSEEVVWSNLSSMWALDLAGGTTRAMVATINDGMGEVTHIQYGTSTQLAWESEQAGTPWTRKLPRSMAVPVRQETRYADGTPTRIAMLGIRDGFWDGVERRFGGFLAGRTVVPGDTVSQVRIEQTTFHEGAGDERVLRGKPLEARTEDGLGTVYVVSTSSWSALRPRCLDTAIDPDDPLLKRAVLRSQETAHHEGVTTPITTRVDISYDVEARPFEEHSHGRLDLPGDERTTWKAYASDDATWVRDRMTEEALYRGIKRGAGTLVAHTRHYFGNHQGDPLPHGQVGFGWPRKSEGLHWQGGSRPTAPHWITLSTTKYDAHGNVIESAEGPTEGPSAVGVTRTFGYDADGLFPVRESVEPVPGRPLSWTAQWDAVLGTARNVTEPAGNTTHVEYDGLGRVMALRQNSLPAHQRFAYDWTAPRPRTFSYAYDGDPQSQAAFANEWQRTDKYRGWRHTVTVADSAGEALFSAGRLNTNEWLISGWKRKDGRGRVTEVLEGFTHRAADLPSAPPTDRTLRRQIVRYDAMDRAFEHQLPTGARTRTIYKAFEQTVQVDGLAPVTSYLDGQGRILRTERTIPTNHGTSQVESVNATYDAAGRILALELQKPAGASGAPCTAASALVAHCFTYDSFGRLIEADDPDIGLRQMTYDDVGRLTRHVNGAGQGITLSYDRVGRLVKRLADDGTHFEYSYDAVAGRAPSPGHLMLVKEPTGSVQLQYDQFGRNNYILRKVGATTVFHDIITAPSGALLHERYVRDWKTSLQRDMAGRVVKVVGAYNNRQDLIWEATSFDDAGRLTGERFGNHVVGTYAYDGNGQTNHITIQRSAGGQRLYDVGLTRNEWGAVTDAADGDMGAGLDHTAHFDYDVAGRLTGALLAPGRTAPTSSFDFRYAYDGHQNMVSRQAVQAPRALGQYLGVHCYGQNGAGPRQLTSIVAGTLTPGGSSPCDAPGTPTVASFTYDDAGRQITDNGSRMTYDGLDQLVAVDLPGGIRVEYGYGYEGQRIRTTDNQGSVPEHWITPELREQGGVVEQYVKVGDRIVAKVNLAFFDETPGDGNGPTDTRAHVSSPRPVGLAVLGGLVLLLAGLGAASARRRRSWRPALATLLIVAVLLPGCGTLFGSSDDSVWRPTKTTYFHTGFAAGPVLITSDSATVVDERRYEPFGQAIDSFREPGGFLDSIDYALEPLNILNKPTDPRTGWSYHGARWVAPQTARWLTPDPPVKAPDGKFMGAPWQLHPYQYVEQNPIVYWDPDGRDAEDGAEQRLRLQMARDGVRLEDGDPEVVKSMWLLPWTDQISRELVGHYIDGSGVPIALTPEEMMDCNPVASIRMAGGFYDTVHKLREDGGGSVAFAGTGPGTSLTHGALGTFTVHWTGLLTTNPDGTWEFRGHAQFYDYYDFDPKPFDDKSKRTTVGEIKVRVADLLMPGKPFKIFSILAPVSEGSRERTAVWSRPATYIHENLNILREVETDGGLETEADTGSESAQ